MEYKEYSNGITTQYPYFFDPNGAITQQDVDAKGQECAENFKGFITSLNVIVAREVQFSNCQF